MDCPFCGKEMREGRIPSRDNLKWYESAGENAWGEGIRLNKSFQDTDAFYCSDCRQIILPVPEIEGMLDKMKRKLDAVSEKVGEMQKQREAQRTEAKKEQKKEKLGTKDPWEL